MEPIRLHGKERHDWERAFFARHTRSRQLVLRILAGFAGGKAECWPTNRNIGQAFGVKIRAVQTILRDLESAGAIRCIPDETIFAQRRIVFLGHPGTSAALRTHGGSNAPHAKSHRPGKKRGHEPPMQNGTPISLNGSTEKEKPVAGPADLGPAGEQATDAIMRRFFPWAAPEKSDPT